MKEYTMEELEKLDVAAPNGAFSTFDAEILTKDVAAIPKNGTYVEIGVDQGKSLYIARQVAKPSVKVYGVDLREDPKVKDTIFIQGDSKVLPENWDAKIDVLFIDGDHTYEGCKADMETWIPFVKKNGVVLFHDCDESSPGVVWAVAEYANTHTINSWRVFKRTDRNTSIARYQL